MVIWRYLVAVPADRDRYTCTGVRGRPGNSALVEPLAFFLSRYTHVSTAGTALSPRLYVQECKHPLWQVCLGNPCCRFDLLFDEPYTFALREATCSCFFAFAWLSFLDMFIMSSVHA